MSTPLAISNSDYSQYGCPICLTGEKQGRIKSMSTNAAEIQCAHCGVIYTVCADSRLVSVVNHPLKGKDNV